MPKTIDVYSGGLVVLRTSKGSLIFEQVEEEEPEPAKKTPREPKKHEIKKRSKKVGSSLD